MKKICSKKSVPLNLDRKIVVRVAILRRCLCSFWNNVLTCWLGKSNTYSPLPQHHHRHHRDASGSSLSSLSDPTASAASDFQNVVSGDPSTSSSSSSSGRHAKDSSDLVALKISLLGDCQIGKTSFLTKYVGREKEDAQMTGLNHMDKTLKVRGARIAYSIWEVEVDETYQNHIPVACKDSVAMLFMFDLTSRCTLNSVINWYQQARQWNQTAIPVLVGTKFDDFVQLPIDLQWTIANQARAYAKAMNAPLFFSSATYNINVNKIFKFVTAKLFNLPWALKRNLIVGEPIIDF